MNPIVNNNKFEEHGKGFFVQKIDQLIVLASNNVIDNPQIHRIQNNSNRNLILNRFIYILI